jgi:hypothetical protein
MRLRLYRILFCIAIIAPAVSCSKSAPTGLCLSYSGKTEYFPTCTLTVQPWCGTSNIYSFTSGKDVLISVVATALVPGNYSAGINRWGQFTDNINLQMQANGSATFTGTVCRGSIN